MNIINKLFGSEKKMYSVMLTMDHEAMLSNLEEIVNIVELPENRIRTYKGLTINAKKGSITVSFGTRRDRYVFKKGCEKYINYRCMVTNE